MTEELFLVIVSDRHTDDEYFPYRDKELALKRANEEVEEILKHYNATPEEMYDMNDTNDEWLFHSSLEDSGSVTVRRVYILS